MIQELKAFLLRGDVVTLAVAVVIGAAFTKIVDAFVNGIINPLIAMVAGTPDFSAFKPGGFGVGEVVTAVVNFVLVGIVLFFVVKAAGKKAEDVK
jgi:large conductance mechanosensitive channel